MKQQSKQKSEKEILDAVELRTSELMEKYHGCGQCGLLAIKEILNLGDPLLFKAASGLSGGLGGLRSVCGALSSSALVLGLKYGREEKDLEVSCDYAITKEKESLVPVAKLAKWFEKEFGSIICRDIRKGYLGVELDTSVEWQKQMADELGIGNHCRVLASKTARKVTEMLLQNQ
ncbi:MAG: C-GCAxxG-C-C family protein [Dehalococcoidales bacterium]|nr:C-GCAxxG-C-C family protein [Dehalococcoidales bacterium]